MSRPAPPARGDLRFADPAWQENPFYRRVGRAYLAMENAVTGAVERADMDERTREKARLAAAVLVSALAPVNTLAGNPAALKRAFDTGGLSLARGARNLLADVRAGRLTPRPVDTRPFRLGENLGVTPGSVVFRNDVVEIIEYAPSTPEVRAVPLLIVWSLINRYYVLDLAPGRSFIEYAVSQGFRVFVTSWRNPGRPQAGWDLDTYAAALLAAMEAVAEISGSEQIGTMGLCAGGQLLAATLGHLAARDDRRVAYACFGVSQLDLSVPGVTGLMTMQPLPSLARLATGAAGMVDGAGIAAGFAWLRPDELVWQHWINNYLMGQDPPAFDILAWNDDSTRLPGALVRQLLGIAEGNLLAASGGVTLLGTPVDLAEVSVPGYVVGAETDHLVPWAASPRARFRTGPVTGTSAGEWLAAATTHRGTWWDHWAQWVHARSGALRAAPVTPGSSATAGSERHPPLGARPRPIREEEVTMNEIAQAHLGEALGTDFFSVRDQFTHEQWEKFSTARKFVDSEVIPVAAGYWERAEMPWELIRRLPELGVVGEDIEGYGCAGMSPLACGLVTMELHRGDGSLGVALGVHAGLALRSIALCGSEEQKQRWLPAMARMDLLGAFALTEPEHGSDSIALETTAEPDGDSWVLTGRKRWIGLGTHADLIVTWARDTASGQVGAFVVERGTPGYQATPIEGKVSLRAIWQADITLDRVRVPAANRLPGARSFKDTGRVLAYTRTTCAWAALGHATAAYDAALRYALTRHQFGKPLASFQIIQQRLVTMLADLTAMQLYCMQIARLDQAGQLTPTVAGLAKMHNTRKARALAADARDMLGGNGILLDNHVMRHLADLEAVHTFEGTETMQTLIVGRDITGISAFS